MGTDDIQPGDKVFSRKHLHAYRMTPMMVVGATGPKGAFCGFNSPSRPLEGEWFDVTDLAKELEEGEVFKENTTGSKITPYGMVFYCSPVTADHRSGKVKIMDNIKRTDIVWNRDLFNMMSEVPLMEVLDVDERKHKALCRRVRPDGDDQPVWYDTSLLGTTCQEGESVDYAAGIAHFNAKRAKKVENLAKPRDYYSECLTLDVSNLDPVHDGQDAVTCLIVQFIRRNKFEDNISVLDDCTPAYWRKQVNRACSKLETLLEEALEEAEGELHCGEFGDINKG